MSSVKISDILRIPRHRYFDKDTFNYIEINKMLQRKTQSTMLSAFVHKGAEVVTIIDNRTFKSITRTSNDMNKVQIPKQIMSLLTDDCNSTRYTVIHNHTSDSARSCFSVQDLKVFLGVTNIELMIMCTNNCTKIAAMYKYKLTNENKDKMMNMIYDYVEKGNSLHSLAYPLLYKFMNKGIQYREFVN